MKPENNSFLDTRTILAVLLVGGTFVGWQTYMQKKYPQMNAKSAATSAPATTGAAENANSAAGQANSATTETAKSGAKSHTPDGTIHNALPLQEKVLHFESDTLAFELSSRGMGVKGFKILKYKTRDGKTVELGYGEGLLALETRLTGINQPLDFEIERINPNLFVGRAQYGGMNITKSMEIDPAKYVLHYKVIAEGSDERFVGLTTVLVEDVEPESELSHLNPRRLMQEFYVETTDSHDRIHFAKDDVQKNFSKAKLAAVGSQYFTQAVVDNSAVMPEVKADLNHAAKLATLFLNYPLLNRGQTFELNYTSFVGPKSLTLLQEVGDHLSRVIDFGYFNWIGKHILELLRWFYGLVGNWGVAIVCLTLLVRLLVLPANLFSYKSMRKMQEIQPQIKDLREKYKDDQQKQQAAMMTLMRENKVNPVGGCLPVLLQFPIFIALYQVLGNCIELYQAPFMLWIHDLSLKDPFYVLPVLMGLTMFVQQKITPNTMEPAQQKVLLMMPLIFTIFMVTLPSGLTLYMLVGAVFSVIQQYYFMKPSKTLAGMK